MGSGGGVSDRRITREAIAGTKVNARTSEPNTASETVSAIGRNIRAAIPSKAMIGT